MFSAFVNSFKITELRQRILFTLMIIALCRVGAVIPTPGVDSTRLAAEIQRIDEQVGGGLLGLVNLFSGGALQNCSVFALGIMPYISAAIIFQLLTAVIPSLEKLAREGQSGRQQLTQYTRYLTLGLCLVQGYMLALTLENPRAFGFTGDIVLTKGMSFRLMTVLTLTTGTMLMMWFGEQISDRGIGNGVSLIITVNIISRLPRAVQVLFTMFSPTADTGFTILHGVVLLLLFVGVTAATVAITEAQRKIPVQYAKRVVGRRVYGGQSTYMPLRINYSGVMPIIFAQALLMFPSKVLALVDLPIFKRMSAAMGYGKPAYMIIYGVLILFFAYFWVATQFNPIQIADDLKKYGGYVPGIRPGKPTANYLDNVMTRITLAGAIFLVVIAILPILLASQLQVPFIVAQFFGGTSLLIIVGVMLETLRQVESHLLMRHYDGFLRRGKIRGRL